VTSAGSARVAYALESDFDTIPGSPTWYQPGIDVEVSDLSVDQALSRSRQPNDPTPDASREGNWEGAIGVSFTVTDANFHDLVFADSGTDLPVTTARAPSATWYFESELPSGSRNTRVASGAVVTDASINYDQGEDVTADLTIVYADEREDQVSPTGVVVDQPDEADAYSWHGTTFSVNGLSQPLMQSATLSLSGLARFRRGQDRHPFDAVVDAIEPSFETDAIFTERDQLAIAVDDVDNASYEQVAQVPGEFALENGQGDTIVYSLSGLQPTTYEWADLVAPDADLSEPIEYHVSDVSATETLATT
jgi:hypothetical protein